MGKDDPGSLDPVTMAMAFDKLPMGVSLMRLEIPDDPASFRILYANPMLSELLGVDLRPFVGMRSVEAFPDIIRSGRLERYVEALRTQRTMQPDPFEYGDDRIKKDKYFTWAVPISTDVVMMLMEDRIASRKEAGEARMKEGDLLRQSEERTRAILDNAYDGFVGINEHGLITEWNTAAETMFGWTRQEALGRTLTDTIIPAHYREAHRRGMQRFIATGEGAVLDRRIELSAVRRDGTEFPIELSIRAMKLNDTHTFSAFIADITERKKTQADINELNRTLEQRVADRTNELVKSEARYHNALDIMMEGVSIIGFDWRYVYVNDATTARTVYSREALMGRTLMDVYPGIEKTPMFRVLERCMADRVPETMETEFRFPNGRTGQFTMSIQPSMDGLFILSTEITEKKRAELELTAQREQLEQQNKELEQFAYIASHDLQEPLRMVTSYVQLLQRRYGEKLDSDANEFIAFAVDGTLRMKQLIDDLLAYSRLGRPAALEKVDMNNVLEHVRANLTTAIAECGAVLISEDLPPLRASQTEMVQVMQNLIGNALKFRRDNVIPEVRVTGREEPDQWRFEVRDNGIGMDQQYSEKVFVPFKRLHDKTKYSGSGIGLAVAQKIIHRYGGRIWFTSVLGQGTAFHFTIKRMST
jgi:PAS domain S-box-containing protein